MSHLSSAQNARNGKLTVYEQCKKMIEAKYSCQGLKKGENDSDNKSNDGNDAITSETKNKKITVSKKRKDRFLKENAAVLKMLYAQFIEAQNIANDLKKQARTQSELLAKPNPMLLGSNQCLNTKKFHFNKQSFREQVDVQQTIQEEISESEPCKESINTEKQLNNETKELPKNDTCQEPVDQVIQMRKAKKTPKFECSICNSYFKNKRELILHKKSSHKREIKHNNNNKVFCNVCDKEFKRTKTFVDRCRSHSAAPYVCKGCKRGYFSRKRLKLHHCKAIKEEKPSVWDACKKVLAKKSHQLEPNVTLEVSTPKLPIIKNVFQVQVKKPSNTPVFLNLQEESVNSKNLINENYNINDSECSNVGLRDIHFQTHVMHCRDKSLDSVSCNVCSNACIDTENFQLHCQTHSNDEVCHLNESEESLHVCNTCGKCFTEAKGFQSHLLLHSGKNNYNLSNVKDSKSYMCSKCSLNFTDIEDFQTHSICKGSQNINVKYEESYICNACGSSFVSSENLQSHCLSHANEELFNEIEEEKPIVCNICGQCFTVIERFQLHCLTHDTQSFDTNTELKMPLICNICDISFIEFNDFQFHCLNHEGKKIPCASYTDQKPFVCNVCGACYAELENFKVHYSIHIKN